MNTFTGKFQNVDFWSKNAHWAHFWYKKDYLKNPKRHLETLFIAYNHLQFRNILINRFRFNLKSANIVHKNTPFPKFWA